MGGRLRWKWKDVREFNFQPQYQCPIPNYVLSLINKTLQCQALKVFLETWLSGWTELNRMSRPDHHYLEDLPHRLFFHFLRTKWDKCMCNWFGKKIWSIMINSSLGWFQSAYHWRCYSVAQLRPTLCDSMDCSTLGSSVLHYLPEFAQSHVHGVSDAIQPSHPLSPPSPAFNLSQHQGLFQRVGFWHQVAKGLELQLHHQSFQWIFRADFL